MTARTKQPFWNWRIATLLAIATFGVASGCGVDHTVPSTDAANYRCREHGGVESMDSRGDTATCKDGLAVSTSMFTKDGKPHE